MTDGTDEIARKEIDAKLTSARLTAFASIGVAFLSLVGAAFSGFVSYRSSSEVARIEGETSEAIEAVRAGLKRGDQAISRAKTVADQFDSLLGDGGKVVKRVAFLNLWQLYSDENDRQVVILAALQYGDDDVFELLQLLERDLSKHKDLIRDLTQYKECREAVGDAKNDCGLTERAKHLYAQLDPHGAMDLLLEEMTGYPLASPDDPNLVSLRELVTADQSLIGKIEAAYDRNFPKLAGLSYVLYGYGSKGRFRDAIGGDATLGAQDQSNLVEFLSGWPMRDIDDRDWPSVARFLGGLLADLRTEKKWPQMKPLLRTIKKVKFEKVPDSQRTRIREDVAALVKQDDVLWPIRSEASEVLLRIDDRRLFDTLRDIEVAPGSIVAKEFGRILNERRREVAAVVKAEPPETENFAAWQIWLKEHRNE